MAIYLAMGIYQQRSWSSEPLTNATISAISLVYRSTSHPLVPLKIPPLLLLVFVPPLLLPAFVPPLLLLAFVPPLLLLPLLSFSHHWHLPSCHIVLSYRVALCFPPPSISSCLVTSRYACLLFISSLPSSSMSSCPVTSRRFCLVFADLSRCIWVFCYSLFSYHVMPISCSYLPYHQVLCLPVL